jgi:uncharacterized protein involved in exopolysaccharide biosynthesis
MQRDNEEITLIDMARFIRRRWFILMFTPAAAIALFGINNSFKKPLYTATSIIEVPHNEEGWSGDGCFGYAKSDTVQRQLAEVAQKSDAALVPGSLVTRATLSAQKTQSFVELAVTSNSGQNAALFANSWAKLVVDRASSEAEDDILKKRTILNAELSALDKLANQHPVEPSKTDPPQKDVATHDEDSQSLSIRLPRGGRREVLMSLLTELELQALRHPRIFATAAEPYRPDSTNFLRDLVLAGAAGSLIGLLIAMLIEIKNLSDPNR